MKYEKAFTKFQEIHDDLGLGAYSEMIDAMMQQLKIDIDSCHEDEYLKRELWPQLRALLYALEDAQKQTTDILV